MSIVERKTEITELNENIKNLTRVIEEGSNKIAASILAYAESSKYTRNSYPLQEYANYVKILGAEKDGE